MTFHLKRLKGVDTAVNSTSSRCMGVWKNELVMSIVAHIFPFAQSFRILSIRGSGCESVTVFLFSCRKSFTHRGSMVGSAFGTINAGEACGEAEGQILPASKCCCINVCHASQYLRRHAYVHVLMGSSARFSLIRANTVRGR